MRLAASVPMLLLLLAGLPAAAGAQVAGRAEAPREEVRTEISARVGAIRSVTVREVDTPPSGARVSRVEVASNVPCLLVARGPAGGAVRVSVEGSAGALLEPGGRLVLGHVRPGVHQLRVAVDAGRAGAVPALAYELEDVAEPLAAPGAGTVAGG